MEALLDDLIVGKSNDPPRILVYGPEKIGKSTFAASSPSPVFIQTEDGLGQIGATRFPQAKSYDQVIDQLARVRHAKHDFATLCIDSADWLERLIHAKICQQDRKASIELCAGGYGKGYIVAAEMMQSMLMDLLDDIRQSRGMAIAMVAHSRIDKINEPGVPTYERFVPDLHKHAAAVISEWVDVIGFCQLKIRTEEDKGKEDRFLAHGLAQERVLRLTKSPAYTAGNRYGITQDVPLSWEAFITQMQSSK